MSKYKLNESEKARIRKLHKDYSVIKEQDGDIDFSLEKAEPQKQKMVSPSQASPGDYHMWSHCGGSGTVALYDNNLGAMGQSCHNAVNQGIPGLVLACNQEFVNAYGFGPVLQFGTGNIATKSCWEYQGTQFFNNLPPNIATPSMQNVGAPTTLQNCGQCGGTADMGWMCVDVGGGQGGTGCQNVPCPQGITNTPGGCWSNQIDCDNGGLNPSLNAQPCGGYGTTEHECVQGNCIPWIGGTYANLASCQAACGVQGITHYCIDCAQQIMSTYIVGQGQCPQGMLDLGPQVPQNGPCVDCINGNCVQAAGGWQGPHNSLSDCQQVCSPTGFDCVNNTCTQQQGGQYPTLADCQNSGCGSQNSYDCVDWASPTGCQQVSGSGGQFATLDDCLISPCQCDPIIQAWPFYTNNPNYTANGTWWTYPHDGPSNPNALNQILTNVQNSNAYNSSNVTQRQKARCREAAIFHWQGSGVNVQCCADQSFAVGYATADPLGCVNQNFINLLNNNFIPNSVNWANQGCNWLQNALNNAQTQQQQYPQTSGGYCKLQGKINFIQNLMQTGQSTYINGSVSFTPPC